MKVNHCLHPNPLLVFFIVLTALALSVCIPASQALKPGEVSVVADMQTGLRAIAAMDPD